MVNTYRSFNAGASLANHRGLLANAVLNTNGDPAKGKNLRKRNKPDDNAGTHNMNYLSNPFMRVNNGNCAGTHLLPTGLIANPTGGKNAIRKHEVTLPADALFDANALNTAGHCNNYTA